MRAKRVGITNQRQVQPLAKPAHPADLFCRHACHQGVGFDVAVDDRTGSHKSVFAQCGAADDGAVGTQRGAALNQSVTVFVFAADSAAGVIDVGKDHAGAAKHVVFKRDVVIYRDVVLNLAVIANDHAVAYKYVLAKGTIAANRGTAADMHPVPDAAAVADLGAGVNDGGGVNGDGHFTLVFQRQGHTFAVA